MSRSQVGKQAEIIDRMNSITDSNDRVVAFPPLHPIFRRDTFYSWVHSWAPGNRDTEFLMKSLDSPFAKKFQEDCYRNELEQCPPAMVITGGKKAAFYCPGQFIVLEKYLKERKDMYEPIPMDGFIAQVKKHDSPAR